MPRRLILLVIAFVSPSVLVAGENLLTNASFEQRDLADKRFPANWTETHHESSPLQFTGEHSDGAAGALLLGDGKSHLWRQNIIAPSAREFTLSAWVTAADVRFDQPDDHASLYAHIIYKGRPYASATHLPCKLEPGSYGWKKVTLSGAANNPAEIDMVQISLTGKFSSGRMVIDQVEVTSAPQLKPEALLMAKVEDLQGQLHRIGNVDSSVNEAEAKLAVAKRHLQSDPPEIVPAKEAWAAAAAAVSHPVWKAMFPAAMTDATVEARMLYHAGLGKTAEECDASFETLRRMGGNATLHSLGSWMSVIHHSKLLPIEPGWEQFDALKYSIESAKRRGFKSFGYIAALYGTSNPPSGPDSLYSKHRDWFATGPDPSMPTFLDPANPDVSDFIVKLFVELAGTYDLDGIGLDYIRYPTETSLNYDQRNRDEILHRYNIDIFVGGDASRDPAKWAKIQEYRAENVGKLVKRVRDAVKQVKPRMSVIACLISEPDDCYYYGQNWPVSAAWLDYATPMNYDDRSLNLKMLAQQRDIFARNKTVYIPALGGMPEVHERWTISEWARRVEIQRKIGCDGIIVYRSDGFDPAVAEFFGKGPFFGSAEFPAPKK